MPRVRGTGRRKLTDQPQTFEAVVTVAEPARRRLIVIPPRGMRVRESDGLPTAGLLLAMSGRLRGGEIALSSLGAPAFSLGVRPTDETRLRVLGSIGDSGAKLIECYAGHEGALRAALGGLRLVPEVFYEPLSLELSLESNLEPSGPGAEVTVQVRSAADGAPIPGVHVLGYTKFRMRRGANAITDDNGTAVLSYSTTPSRLERLYAFPPRAHWNALRLSVPVGAAPLHLQVSPIDLAQPHALRHYFGEPPLETGAGVNVAVIDSGVGPHPDLVVAGGLNTVGGEDPAAFHDNGDRHGTHVAGILASRGSAPASFRGVAAGVGLYSYRVFPRGENASNFDIAAAIDRAGLDGCHLINLSLGRPASTVTPNESAVRIALEDARAAGLVAIAAAGNDFRREVAFPADDDLCVAVSAFGLRTLLPPGSASAAAAAPPAGAHPDEFIGEFSNVGPQVDLTAPGVGVISTARDGGHSAMDGTSMAAPVVTGVAARLLAGKPDIVGMAPGAARAKAIVDLVLGAAQTRGFPITFEGRGFPA